MKVLVKRIARKEDYTIGKLYVDGVYVCDTLEDTDRGYTQDTPEKDIIRTKIPNKTAIPTGTYRMTVDIRSPKFDTYEYYHNLCNGRLPRLMEVPGFRGILIHCGVSSENTSGCILVGYNKVVGRLCDSKSAFEKLYSILQPEVDILITIA